MCVGPASTMRVYVLGRPLGGGRRCSAVLSKGGGGAESVTGVWEPKQVCVLRSKAPARFYYEILCDRSALGGRSKTVGMQCKAATPTRLRTEGGGGAGLWHRGVMQS